MLKVSLFQAHAHGGPDDGLPIEWDLSTNANSVPLPADLQAQLLAADRRLYPEPTYARVRKALASWHGACAERIVPTAGSSEGIRRLTLAAFLAGYRQVCVPEPGYADYRAAAQALGMEVHALSHYPDLIQRGPVLLWLCEPCNPTGGSLPAAFWSTLMATLDTCTGLTVALDRAYEPLRLQGQDHVPAECAARCWQLHSPNKALGLTGVRAGWMLAPEDDASGLLRSLQQLAPSWVLSAEGESLLAQWPRADVQGWLSQTRDVLRDRVHQQRLALAARGWVHQASHTHFVLSHHPQLDELALADLNAFLRQHGIKWRDATNLGLPGWVRWRAHDPQAHAALLAALDQWAALRTPPGRRAA